MTYAGYLKHTKLPIRQNDPLREILRKNLVHASRFSKAPTKQAKKIRRQLFGVATGPRGSVRASHPVARDRILALPI